MQSRKIISYERKVGITQYFEGKSVVYPKIKTCCWLARALTVIGHQAREQFETGENKTMAMPSSMPEALVCN